MPTPLPLEDQVAALGGALDRATRRIGTHDDQIRGLAEHVTTLFERTSTKPRGRGTDGEAAPRLCWLTVDDPTVAYEALARLVDWIEAVYLRYPRTSLPSCWLWHPWAVEELLVLQAAHEAAYAADASPRDALEWHSKHLPGVAGRIDAELGTHTLELHEAGQVTPLPVPAGDPTTVSRVVPEWVDHRAMPTPSPVEVVDAITYDQHRQKALANRDKV